MEFSLHGGSMGSVVGEKIAEAARRSHEKKGTLVLVSASVGPTAGAGVLSSCRWQDLAAIAQLNREKASPKSPSQGPDDGGGQRRTPCRVDLVRAEPVR